MIGYMQETHSETPMVHEWVEAGVDYRSLCNRWTTPKENVVAAAEVSCDWCLTRRRRRQEAQP